LTNEIGYFILAMKTYSTVKVAKMLGIGWSTLHRWIVDGKVKAPPIQTLGGVKVRLWTVEDIEGLRKYKNKHYWGKGGRKKRKKRTK
jgi:predicted DNA-binding transcriptional regulator AlpA